jgi:hypothetical protein
MGKNKRTAKSRYANKGHLLRVEKVDSRALDFRARNRFSGHSDRRKHFRTEESFRSRTLGIGPRGSMGSGESVAGR